MKHTILSLLLLFISTSVFAARKEILLNENWMFRFSHQVQFKSEERVNLPHTWNSGDALFRVNRITIAEWVTIPKRCS